MVIMLDRSIGTQVPYIFNEKPELLEKYDGFTYYENTISYSSSTITASPALFGGYDYTPEKINARADDSLASKQNEALKVMPILFGSNGYKVTIIKIFLTCLFSTAFQTPAATLQTEDLVSDLTAKP